MAGLMALAILSVRPLGGDDMQVIIALAAFGVWCIVLALRARSGSR